MDEGRKAPTADGWRRELSPTASHYPLRQTQACACQREKSTWPSIRLSSLPIRALATNTGSRQIVMRQPYQQDRRGRQWEPSTRGENKTRLPAKYLTSTSATTSSKNSALQVVEYKKSRKGRDMECKNTTRFGKDGATSQRNGAVQTCSTYSNRDMPAR